MIKITQTLKVYFRENVSHSNVQGTSWKEIERPNNLNVISCSCNKDGNILLTVFNGSFLFRTGISRNVPYGTDWLLLFLLLLCCLI